MDGSQHSTIDRLASAGVVLASETTALAPDQGGGEQGEHPRILYVDHSSKIAGAELVLLDVIEGGRAGSAVFLFQDGPLVDAIRERGVAPIMSARAGDLSGIRRDGGLLRAVPRIAGLIGTALEIASAARSRDIIYANSQKAFVLSAVARLVTHHPLVWHLHDILDRSHFGAAQIRLVTVLANHCACCVIVPSSAAAVAFIAAGGRAERVHIVPNGVDLARPDEPALVLRARLGLPGGFLFGVFSRLAPWKGQHVAIEALRLLPNAQCAIVGDAQFGEDVYARHLREIAVTLGVADRVLFLGHRGDIAQLMSAVDAVVHPSVDPEPFGRTLVEAMGLGTPVIATEGGAASDILDRGRCGKLVPPGNAEAIAEALRSVSADPARWSAITTLAASRARSLYNASRMRTAIRALLTGIWQRTS